MIQIEVIGPHNQTQNLLINSLPEECPFCHCKINTQFLNAFYREEGFVDAIFKCPSNKCQNIFIAYYKRKDTSKITSISQKINEGMKHELQKIMVGTFVSKKFSETIESISPSFISIYNQAKQTEEYHLDQVAGMGYRKALEFLIKDYCIKRNPEKEDDIIKLLLGECIKKYITNQRIKDISQRAVWLGNDETHYVKKWVDKDINDLKLLIDITLNWIELEELSDKYTNEMQ